MNHQTPEAISPLLVELARLFRARQFYPSEHPAFREALERAAAAWGNALPALERVEVVLDGSGFHLPNGPPLHGAGLDELALELAGWRVSGLCFASGLTAEELEKFVDLLCSEGVHARRARGLADALEGAGIRNPGVLSPGPEAGRGTTASTPSSGESEQLDIDVERSQATAALVRALEELERCDSVADYNGRAVEVERQCDVLCRAKNVADAYRAVLCWTRHATDAGGRDGMIRTEASDRLARVLRGDRMLQFVVDQACGAVGVASVQATQVLIAVGPTVVPRVLEKLACVEGQHRAQAGSVLVAMGEQAFPALVDQLTSPEPGRVRRAARLLGEIQNPRGVEFLVEHLAYPDAMVKKEVARALVQIGTSRAMDALLTGLRQPATAELAAAALGGAASSHATRVVQALIEVAEDGDRELGIRREAIRSLGRLACPDAMPVLRRLLERRSLFGRKKCRTLRVVAAQSIGRIGGDEAFALLETYSRRGDAAVRDACRHALYQIARTVGM
jgi:hypothetical protein